MKSILSLVVILLIGITMITLLSRCTNKQKVGTNTYKNSRPDLDIAYQVVEKLIEEKFVYVSKTDLDHAWAYKNNPEKIKIFPRFKDPGYIDVAHGKYEIEFYCFPRNDGGYYVIEVVSEVGCDPDDFAFFNYKDGKVERANNNHKPSLKDFAISADQIPSALLDFFQHE